MPPRQDLVVVGGGPVGLATAIEAQLRGLTVTVVEARPGVRDKACGEGLMPAALESLHSWGIVPGGHNLRGIEYLQRSPEVSDGLLHQVSHQFRAGQGLGVRRTELHRAMQERAEQLGVNFVTARVSDVRSAGDWVEAAGVRASWLIAADGLHSPLRKSLGVQAAQSGRRRWGVRQHFAVEPWSDYVQVYWTPDAEAYVTPVAANLVGVAVLSSTSAPFDEHLRHIPDLARNLGEAPAASSARGAGPLRQSASQVLVGRVMFVGDAAEYVDALTGEGMRVGFAQAQQAVHGIATDTVDQYPKRWRSVTREARWLTRGLLAATARPAIRERLVPAAERFPSVFGLAVDRLAG